MRDALFPLRCVCVCACERENDFAESFCIPSHERSDTSRYDFREQLERTHEDMRASSFPSTQKFVRFLNAPDSNVFSYRLCAYHLVYWRGLNQ